MSDEPFFLYIFHQNAKFPYKYSHQTIFMQINNVKIHDIQISVNDIAV